MRHYLSIFILVLLLIGNGADAQDLSGLQPINNANAVNMQLLTTLNTGADATTLGWSPNGTILAVATQSNLLLYDSRNLNLSPRELPISQVISLAFNLDSQLIATSSNFGGPGMGIWNVETGEQLTTFKEELPTFNGMVPAVDLAFSPDGNVLASQHYLEHLGNIYDRWVRLWNTQTGELLAKIDGGGTSVTFSSDGKLLSATTPGTVRVWTLDRILSTKSDEILLEDLVLNGYGPITFSADDNQVAYRRDGEIQIWDIKAEKIINRSDNHVETGSGCIVNLPFATIVNNYQATNYIVQLWDGCQNELITTLKGYTDIIKSAVFSPDGTLLATASQDGIVRFWGIPAD